ncbi:putative DedA family protein [Prochlorococcus sp. SS52]|nr:putative DedA family protein [Prochlorococcus marinus str. LG]KGG23865.1 putative DedA family protein [Prochlorococcus marinus str. SS35]KGG31875.1 putative DedA family protein [Prochlorococcus marinus str. SS51]KGG35960.1 putative DedA family protein [Prochlorococcus sp. SS52]
MLAGLIYGSFLGSIFVFIGATLGAVLTFYSVRIFLRSWIQSRLSLWPKLQSIENTITNEGLKLIIMMRLSPAFPFGLLNLAYGISNVKFRDFLIGLLAIAPGTFLYCSLGSLAGEISRFNEILSNKSEWNSLFYTILSLISTAIVVFILARGVNKSLKDSNEIN